MRGEWLFLFLKCKAAKRWNHECGKSCAGVLLMMIIVLRSCFSLGQVSGEYDLIVVERQHQQDKSMQSKWLLPQQTSFGLTCQVRHTKQFSLLISRFSLFSSLGTGEGKFWVNIDNIFLFCHIKLNKPDNLLLCLFVFVHILCCCLFVGGCGLP